MLAVIEIVRIPILWLDLGFHAGSIRQAALPLRFGRDKTLMADITGNDRHCSSLRWRNDNGLVG